MASQRTKDEGSQKHVLQQSLQRLDASSTEYATQFVDAVLDAARNAAASDVHLQPTAAGLEVKWRLDGVLQRVGVFPRGDRSDVVARLKVMAELLTYRCDVPQEGRLRGAGNELEIRVSTFPTIFGERTVLRLFASETRHRFLEDLELPDAVLDGIRRTLSETSGALLVTGPAGSGKTTTAYAVLRELVRVSDSGMSLVSIEDPVEVIVEGVAQAQVAAGAGFDFATGLRSLMRQDPEVILVGEIRDRETAETTFQAALTGHLVVTTFHANSAAGAVSRLSDMGIEAYLLRSGIRAILSQRLVRRLCTCAVRGTHAEDALGLAVQQFHLPVGCEACHGTGYRGRMPLAELLEPEPTELGRAILSRSDAAQIETLAIDLGMISRWQRAVESVEAGWTSPAEIRRVLGVSDGFGSQKR
jgi:general secretion pathway protein E